MLTPNSNTPSLSEYGSTYSQSSSTSSNLSTVENQTTKTTWTSAIFRIMMDPIMLLSVFILVVFIFKVAPNSEKTVYGSLVVLTLMYLFIAFQRTVNESDSLEKMKIWNSMLLPMLLFFVVIGIMTYINFKFYPQISRGNVPSKFDQYNTYNMYLFFFEFIMIIINTFLLKFDNSLSKENRQSFFFQLVRELFLIVTYFFISINLFVAIFLYSSIQNVTDG